MFPSLRKEFRIVWLPLAIGTVAAFVCGIYFVNDNPHLNSSLLSGTVGLGTQWCPGVLCISLAILAGLAFGSEYQYRTLNLLLTHPVPRSRTWNQKSAVLASCAALIVCAWIVGNRVSLSFHLSPGIYSIDEVTSVDDALLSIAGFVLATLCSAGYWSLVARSVIGGIVLNAGFQLLAGLLTALITEKLFKGQNAWRAVIWASPIYALGFFLLGRRKFLRLQATTPFGSEHGGAESFSALKWEIPLLRPARHSGFANLVCKEVRLNKPLFLIAGFYVVSWFLALLVMKSAHVEKMLGHTVLAGITTVYICLIFGLAGSVSLGEEKSMGTHAAQLILPVAKWKLWSAKLLVAFLVSVVLGFVLPAALMTSRPVGNEGTDLRLFVFSWVPVAGCIVLTLVGFWAATHFQNSIIAVLATVLFLPAISLPAIFGNLGSLLLIQPDGLQAPLLSFLSVHCHLSPVFFGETIEVLFYICLPTGICVLLLIQSVKQFSSLQPSAARVIRHFGTVFVVSALACIWFGDFATSASHLDQLVPDTQNAFLRALPKTPAAQAVHEGTGFHEIPLQQIVDTGELSRGTTEWLLGAKVSVAYYTVNRGHSVPKTGCQVRIAFPHERLSPWVFDILLDAPKSAEPQ